MSFSELRPHFPGYIDVAPTCQDSEWRWLEYFHSMSAEQTQPKKISVVSIDNPSMYWNTDVVQKGRIGDQMMGSKTSLCLTGEIAGFVAANTLSHAERLRAYYHLRNEHFMFYGGVLMRPLLMKPFERKGFEPLRDMYQINGNENWYLESLLAHIEAQNLPLDRERFIENVVNFSQSFQISRT